MVQLTLLVVLVAGLEPARSLERGLLSPARLKICVLKKPEIELF